MNNARSRQATLSAERRDAPICPFCQGALSVPQEIRISETEDVLGGRCLFCRAHFIVDKTGKNVGEAMMQGLRLAAEDLGKDPVTMIPGEDYEDAVLSYDWKRHRSSGTPKNFMDGYGRLYSIKVLKKRV